MKKFISLLKKLSLLLIATSFLLSACKKEDSIEEVPLEDDGLTEEAFKITGLESDLSKLGTGALKALLDTNNLAPKAKYLVFYKSSFQQPLVASYSGTDEGKADAAALNEREFKTKVWSQFRTPVVNDTDILEWFSVLSCGYFAELTPYQVKELYKTNEVDYIAKEPVYEADGDVSYVSGAEPMFVHGYKKVSSTTKKIWILDTGCDTATTRLNLDPLSKNFFGGKMNSLANHGNRVAHIASSKEYGSANMRGTAEGARIVMLKVGNADSIPWRSLNKGLEYCWIYSKKGDIVNLSLSVSTVAISDATNAAIIQMESNLLKYENWEIPIVIAAGNQEISASDRSPARLGLKYKEDKIKYGFIHVVANIVPIGTEAQIKGVTTNFALKSTSNYGRAVRWGLIGTWLSINTNGTTSVGSGTSYSAPALCGILYHNSSNLGMPSTCVNVIKYKKNSTNYTHLVPTLK